MRYDSSRSSRRRLTRLFSSRRFIIVALGAAVIGLGISLFSQHFRSDHITVNPNDKNTPQHPYRYDELALLQISLDQLMDKETRKDYEGIYDQLTARTFKKRVPKRIFLKMANCVEQYLGSLITYDHDNHGFYRIVEKGKPYEQITLHVERSETPLEERITFVSEDLEFRLSSLHWMTDRNMFHECIRQVRTRQEPAAPLSSTDTSTEPTGAGTEPVADGSANTSNSSQQSTDDSTSSGNEEPAVNSAPAVPDSIAPSMPKPEEQNPSADTSSNSLSPQ